MKQKSNVFIGIFILILFAIGIIMPLFFFNTQEAEGLNITNIENYNFELKNGKEIEVYIPIIKNEAGLKPNNQEEQGDDILKEIDKEVSESITKILEEYQDEIDQKDIEQGKVLLEKLDLNYLLSFDRNNLTEDQKQEIKNYLQGQLSSQEYEKVLELIGKYIGLIS